MLLNILALGIEFVVQTGFLFAALWIMIRLQKMDYRFLGLLVTAAVATALDLVPYCGHYLAVPVLYLCIARMSRADIFPDVVFTVVISYALTFVMNLFLLGAFLGDLRPSARELDAGESYAIESTFDDEDSGDATGRDGAVLRAGVNVTVTRTNGPAKTGTVSQTAGPSSAVVPANMAERPSGKTGSSSGKTGASTPLSAADAAKGFSLKGVSKSASTSLAVIHSGVKTYTIGLGETLTMDTAAGKLTVRCDEVAEQRVLLNVVGEPVSLTLW